MASLLDLSGRVAIVTGSTRGIGWATARLLAAHGATVIVNSRSDAEAAEKRAEELTREFEVPALGLVADAAEPEEVAGAYRKLFERFGRLDVLVNNAGVLQDALIGMITGDLLSEVLRVNLCGAVFHLQAAARLMQRRGSGSIVNVSSIIGVEGNSGQAVYGSSKAALIGLTLSSAKELAGRGIRVNAVAPGFIDTDMTRALPVKTFEARVASVAMGRVGQPEDIARAVLFLASDLAAYVTGQVLGVDGGMLI